MSASNKKKLRKEQNAAVMTEKQLNEMKEAKKLKNYTLTFFISMALVVVVVIGILLRVPIATVINRNTIAISIDDKEYTAVELNYYFADAVSDYYNELKEVYNEQANLYAQWFYGLNFAKDLDKQVYDNKTGETWGHHFLETAKENARTAYALYKLAMEKGYKVSAEEQEDIDITVESLELAAKYMGYSSTTAYVRSLYGPGATPETFAKYYEVNKVATSYYASIVKGIGDKLTDEDFRKHEKDIFNNFSSFTYYTYTVGMADYIKGGTLSEDGKTTNYTDAEKDAARAAAKAAAELLSGEKYSSIEEFNKAIAALPTVTDNKNATSTEVKNLLYTDITDERIQKWVSDSARKEFDVTMIPAESTTTDADGKETTVVNGYYVIVYSGVRDNKIPLANVRHILVMFEGGTQNSDGSYTYTDAQKEKAKTEAEELLKQWENGTKTEESFSTLAKEKSDDTGTKKNGGLVENINPDAGLVDSFLDWSLAEHDAGDTGIIESEYGYHVMYYVNDGELTYRDLLIKSEIVGKESNAWLDELIKDVKVVDVDLSRVYYDYSPV